MVKVPEKVIMTIKDYLQNLSNEIPIERALLFGSYAKGNFSKDSDVDIAIFSEYFNNMKRVDGIRFLLRKAVNYPDIDLQPIPFTHKDYIEMDGFVTEVLKHGIEIEF